MDEITKYLGRLMEPKQALILYGSVTVNTEQIQWNRVLLF